MKLRTPRWWYQRPSPSPVTRMLLTPLSWIWSAFTARRIRSTIAIDPGAPVICVGGLTVGGAGKTPVAQAVLERLRGRGVNAVALSRGYGGRLIGPEAVDPDRHTAADVGDEPLMLAAVAPAFIAQDRVAGARAAVAAGAEIVVLDDGHQNPSLSKSLSLVVVDAETRAKEWPFGEGGVFPAGPLREPLRIGLARADAVILMLPADLAEPDGELLDCLSVKPVLIARLAPAAAPPSGPQVGFAGIAKPWRVERSLQAAGCDLKDFVPFPDHAPYTEDALMALLRRAEDFGAGLVTTEKDWVRLPPEWRCRITAWPVRAVFEDPAALDALLNPLIGRAAG